ncbi:MULTISPECIES: hypothetical protein [unclassified Lentimonas]|uniref:hypothetical protein n=1 Tax=unclassified Lentimonas TaxID=2630993 RepID=UPI00132BCF70|nr:MULTISPECIES: hypothetical protein [unclassified Lentimonas]CAA6676763.1 Unannotated [Lentimonas sp. CC4]CAA6684572.1 Unannotated [Lentimonas sp. CC6]CAA7075208.1 Unannotated [Lentimonas sp. CC4]CAA7170593.1 Unannotated [Lentimonas sp. CC21]CAA7183199.1 Unannotated [Lentimonas sp. CC8]
MKRFDNRSESEQPLSMHTHRLAILILALFMSSSALQAADFHTFKDTQGREMEAKITRISGDDVYIERRDGLSTKVKRSIFSKKDQSYIEEWAKEALLQSDILEVRFTEKKTDKHKASSGGIKSETYKSNNSIVIENTAYEDLSDLTIEYLILKFEDAISAQKRSEGQIRRLKSNTTLKYLPKRSEVSVETKPIPMMDTKLESGYYFKNGGKETSKDEIRGIWVKIYVGDTLVHEISKPENMMRKEAW